VTHVESPTFVDGAGWRYVTDLTASAMICGSGYYSIAAASYLIQRSERTAAPAFAP
jgi:hypothetical protein